MSNYLMLLSSCIQRHDFITVSLTPKNKLVLFLRVCFLIAGVAVVGGCKPSPRLPTSTVT